MVEIKNIKLTSSKKPEFINDKNDELVLLLIPCEDVTRKIYLTSELEYLVEFFPNISLEIVIK